MYNEPGLGYGASYGSVGHAVADRASADAAVVAHAAGAGSVQLYDTYHPGICDPMPGWKVTWNPPDCSTQETPDVRGLMPSAAWTQTEALAPAGLAATPSGEIPVRPRAALSARARRGSRVPTAGGPGRQGVSALAGALRAVRARGAAGRGDGDGGAAGGPGAGGRARPLGAPLPLHDGGGGGSRYAGGRLRAARARARQAGDGGGRGDARRLLDLNFARTGRRSGFRPRAPSVPPFAGAR